LAAPPVPVEGLRSWSAVAWALVPWSALGRAQ
jgi:hypothetical protein